jgi:hypothetical protein
LAQGRLSLLHGELLKLGFEVAQSSVAKYMVKRRGPPSQGWQAFLRNHAPDIAAMDLFVVPTIGFDLLYAFVIVRLDRRDLVWINVTPHPTAEWVARQITGPCPRIAVLHHIVLFVLAVTSLRRWTSLRLWMVIGDDISRVDTVSVETCACRKLNPGILVMQSAQGWATKNVPGAIDGARDRCIFLQG